VQTGMATTAMIANVQTESQPESLPLNQSA
jgi:hypothetical protein